MYKRAEFAKELEQQLRYGYDPVQIARWAYEKYSMVRELENGLEPEILKVVAMEEGPEFEMTKEELLKLATRLAE